jgi:hypothetical protein
MARYKYVVFLVLALIVEMFAIPPACTYYDLYLEHWSRVGAEMRNP